MTKNPQWTIEILSQGDPVRLSLGIDWGDMLATPVEIDVPLSVVQQGAERIAGFFLESCRERGQLREDLDLPDNIEFI